MTQKVYFQDIDSHGRLSVPGRFKASKKVMVFAVDNRLVAYDCTEYQDLKNRLAEVSQQSGAVAHFTANLIANTREMSIDAGTIFLEDLKDAVAIRQKSVIVEKPDRFEIWPADLWTQP